MRPIRITPLEFETWADERFEGIRDAARRLGLSPSTIWRWKRQRGPLPAYVAWMMIGYDHRLGDKSSMVP